MINYSGTALFVHETTHAGQFESGDIAFDSNNGNSLAQDVFDEIAGYKAQFANLTLFQDYLLYRQQSHLAELLHLGFKGLKM